MRPYIQLELCFHCVNLINCLLTFSKMSAHDCCGKNTGGRRGWGRGTRRTPNQGRRREPVDDQMDVELENQPPVIEADDTESNLLCARVHELEE